jgi:hypothetical protein
MLHAEAEREEERDWVAGLINAAGARFAAELAAGAVDGPRLLLRFFGSLVCTRVLHPADVLGLMARVLEVAQAQAAAGGCGVLCCVASITACLLALLQHCMGSRRCADRLLVLLRTPPRPRPQRPHVAALE